jgi:uncharacterized membrane protein YdjX (TVP38/TMEM64 family)
MVLKNITVKLIKFVNSNENLDKAVIVRNILFAVIVFGILIYTSIKYTPDLLKILSSTDNLRQFLLSYGNIGIFVFLGIQTVHILIPIIPGEIVQIGGGYVYGTVWGVVLLYIGMVFGTIIVLFISKMFGYPIVKIFVGKRKIKQFERILKNKKIEVILIILFILPGIPKDAILYITGLMPIRPLRIVIMSTTARLPGVIGSAYIGANLMNRNYTAAIIVGGISVLIFIIGVVFRKKVFSIVNNF